MKKTAALLAIFLGCAFHPSKTQGSGNVVPAGYASTEAYIQYDNAVALLVWCDGKIAARGSGVFVSSNVVATAKHMIDCEDKDVTRIVMQKTDVTNDDQPPKYTEAAPLYIDSEYDFALVKLSSHFKTTVPERSSLPTIDETLCYVGGLPPVKTCLKVVAVSEKRRGIVMTGDVFKGDSGSGLYKGDKLVGIIIANPSIGKKPAGYAYLIDWEILDLVLGANR